MGLRTIFFGTSDFAVTVLQRLIESPHEVLAVVAAPDRRSGRGRKVRRGPVSALAADTSLPLIQPVSLRPEETRLELQRLGADVFAVASYGLIFPESALSITRFGAINTHASLLPLLRGASPIETALLEGYTSTGISIQRMVREVDAGDVLCSESTGISKTDNAGSLGERLAHIASGLLVTALNDLEQGKARPLAQDTSRVTYAPPHHSNDRGVIWSEGAEKVFNRIRAFTPRPGAFTILPEPLGSKRLKVLEAEVVHGGETERPNPDGTVLTASRHDGLVVSSGEKAVKLLTVQPEGKRAMDAPSFLAGHPLEPGQTFGNPS